jgi:hypothetical protein
MSLADAVVDAGAVRFRPMMLTAAAVIVGTSVLLFDPIFQGLAISLMAGEAASLLLSRMAVPVHYYLSERGSAEEEPAVSGFKIFPRLRSAVAGRFAPAITWFFNATSGCRVCVFAYPAYANSVFSNLSANCARNSPNGNRTEKT